MIALIFVGAAAVVAIAMLVLLGLPLLRTPAEAAQPPARRARFAAIVFLAAAPIAAAAIYLRVGSPALIEAPELTAVSANDIATLPEDERTAMIEQMVEGLAARLKEQPNDPEGWRMLARSQFVLRRPADSAESHRRLLALEDGTLDDWRNFATALAVAGGSDNFPDDAEFLAALEEIEKRAPGDRMALFYRGGAARTRGDNAAAVELWSQLLETMPADAPVRGTLEQLIADAQQDALAPE